MFCQSQAIPPEKYPEKARFCLAVFDFQKKPSALKRARISKSGFKKAKLATLSSFCGATALIFYGRIGTQLSLATNR